MKSREFERFLLSKGCTLVRTDGDHHIWQLPNGRKMVVPVGGRHTEAKPYLEARYRRLQREAPEPRRSGHHN